MFHFKVLGNFEVTGRLRSRAARMSEVLLYTKYCNAKFFLRDTVTTLVMARSAKIFSLLS